MKKLLFIALLLSFLMGNAQQDRQQFGPNGTKAPVQLYLANDIDPGYPIAFDLNRNKIRKTDNHPGYSGEVDVNRYSIRKPDNHPAIPIEFDLNRYTIRKTDNIDPRYPIAFDLNRYTIKKTY